MRSLYSLLQPELIEAHGYVAETHQICTEDGYYLTAHRVLLSNDRVPSNDTIINTDAAVIDSKNSEDCNSSGSPDCQRIVESLESYINLDSKLPVIVNHGILSSSADWVLLGPQKSLGQYHQITILLFHFLNFLYFVSLLFIHYSQPLIIYTKISSIILTKIKYINGIIIIRLQIINILKLIIWFFIFFSCYSICPLRQWIRRLAPERSWKYLLQIS